MKSNPSAINDPSLAFFKDYLLSLGAQMPTESTPMGDFTKEVSEEDRDAAQMYKANANKALSEGNLEEAITQLTMAILLNPTSAILYATRAGVLVKLKRPKAAIVDANRALEINPDSAKG